MSSNLLNEEFGRAITKLVYQVLEKEGLMKGEWHLGEVDAVVSPTRLSVFVDGSDVAQTVSCNPDVTFNIGDQVFVVFINNDPKDKFVLCRRGI